MQTLKIQSRLSDKYQSKPQWSVSLQVAGRTLSFADPTATRAMVALMDMEAQLNGAASHFGGPSAFAELMSATFALVFEQAKSSSMKWFEVCNFSNDAGHCENGLYALKANYQWAGVQLDSLKKFRSIESKLTGHGEAHLFPEGVLVSNGPLGSSLPVAQGLSHADAISGNWDRVTVCALSDGGAMEGEAREALAAIPGLAQKRKQAPFVLIISDNKTKLSGRIEADAFSMQPSFHALNVLGWEVLEVKNGNDLKACAEAVEKAFQMARANPSRPVAIHAHTVKGFGNKKAVESKTGAHGFPLKSPSELPEFLTELYQGQSVPSEFSNWAEEIAQRESVKASKPKMAATVLPQARGALLLASSPAEKIQTGVSAALIDAAKKGLPVFSVTADLQGSTGVADFHKAFPDRVTDVGIAESNMISVAAGLSLNGFIPVIDTFAQFGVTKGALPLTMASLSNAPVIGFFSHTGFQDAADGASHQALSFIAQSSTIPGVDTYALSSSAEAYDLVTEAIEEFAKCRERGETPRSSLFFLGRENFPKRLLAVDKKHRLNEWPILLEPETGSPQVILVALGSLVGEALKASDLLSERQIRSAVVQASKISRPDIAKIETWIKGGAKAIVTVEEHRKPCGMGSMLSQVLAEKNLLASCRIQNLGIMDHFGQSAYSALELYKLHHLDAKAIKEAAVSLL